MQVKISKRPDYSLRRMQKGDSQSRYDEPLRENKSTTLK